MSMNPPMSAGAMLSAWYPLTTASEASPAMMSVSLLSGQPNRVLTAQAEAAAEAALLPMPDPSGRPLRSVSATPHDGAPPSSRSVSIAAMPAGEAAPQRAG